MNRSGGFGRAVGVLVTALGTLGAVFLLGIGAGVVLVAILGLWVGSTTVERPVVWQEHRDGTSSIVAVVPVRGVIDKATAAFIRSCTDDILSRRNVSAIVLRVDSPGGEVAPSDQIWYEVGRLRQRGITVVASYGGVAASGGYYVSCASDFIMAEETSVTGSIGVIAQIMTFEGLFEKVGIEPVTLVARRSPEKNVANDIFRSWTDEDRAQVITLLDDAYETFRNRVATGRSAVLTDAGRVDDIATGAVFTAKQALAAGLIDGIGYLDDAILQAEQLAGLAPGSATIMMLYQRPTLFGDLSMVGAGRGPNQLDADAIRTLINDLGSVRLMYLMPRG